MSTSKIIELTDDNVCEMCKTILGKYKCPKCSILYCSLACYQHSTHLQCSETFYKDSLYEQLKEENGESGAKEKMLEILRRTHEGDVTDQTHSGSNSKENGENEGSLDSDDESDSEDDNLAERMNGVNLDDAEDVWKHLNVVEKKQFEAFLSSGDAGKFIEKWQPWWLYNTSNKVLDLTDFALKCKDCPKKYSGIKKFTDITKKPPASCLKHNLTNILASYLFVCRYFNGEYLNAIIESVSYLLTTCLTLKENVNFDSCELAVSSVKSQCNSTEWILTDCDNLDLINSDLMMILQGPHSTQRNYYVICALSELHVIFKRSLENDKVDLVAGEFYATFTSGKMPNFVKEQRSLVKLAMKKIEYFLAYTNDCL